MFLIVGRKKCKTMFRLNLSYKCYQTPRSHCMIYWESIGEIWTVLHNWSCSDSLVGITSFHISSWTEAICTLTFMYMYMHVCVHFLELSKRDVRPWIETKLWELDVLWNFQKHINFTGAKQWNWFTSSWTLLWLLHL